MIRRRRSFPTARSVALIALFFTSTLAASACGDDDAPVPTAAAGAAGGAGATTLSCELAAPEATTLVTSYLCPSTEAAMLCREGSPSLCAPQNRSRGTVAPGSACQRGLAAGDAGAAFELGDDCAPNSAFFWPDWPKGSFCQPEVEGGRTGYCSHACASEDDCADVASARCDSAVDRCVR